MDSEKNIAIFPFGDIGYNVSQIMREVYGRKPDLILDNHVCHYNDDVKPLSYLSQIDCAKIVVIFATNNRDLYHDLKECISKYECECIEIDGGNLIQRKVSVGKYTYGVDEVAGVVAPLESIGSFCSIAPGARVLPNHPVSEITTHSMIYANSPVVNWYVPGIVSRDLHVNDRKTKIGNDVWIGQNVLICNGAQIGNGVVAAAGAVIVHDIPDYAVVAGVPARIIRYRYKQNEIDALNRIAWWDWSDDEIRERFEDFYLPIADFIEKYDTEK